MRLYRYLWMLLLIASASGVLFSEPAHAGLLRPDLSLYRRHMGMPPASASGLKVTFLGNTTLLFDDGETAWMTDGFLTRPPLLRVLFGRIEPDNNLISSILKRLGIQKLAAVIPIHSHYDHVLDAPIVAQQTGALLLGSESTAAIGRGYGLAEDRIRTIKDADRLQFGRFKVKVILSEHSPDAHYPGQISDPLEPPAKASDYKMGDSYSLLVEHDGKSILVHGSAGFRAGALAGHKADVVFLGTGTLGRQADAFKENYWQETVRAVGAKRIIAIHWDDFFRPLDQEMLPMLRFMDDLSGAMDFLLEHAAKDELDVYIPRAWDAGDPFEGIPPHS